MLRHLLTVFLFILFSQSYSFCQAKRELEPAFFVKAEVAPSYPGGEIAWENYVLMNLKDNIPAEKSAPQGVYAVVIKFLVEKDGSLSDITAVTNFGYGMEEEAKRLIKEGEKWIPATQNGRTVRCYQKQAVIFRNITDIQNAGVVVPPTPRILIENTSIEEIEAVYKIYKEADVDIKAGYVGGIAAWHSFLDMNMNKRTIIRNGAKPSKYEVVVQFVVSSTGILSNIIPLTSEGFGMEDEAIRLIKKTAGLWTPAILNAKEVYSYRRRQIIFNLEHVAE